MIEALEPVQRKVGATPAPAATGQTVSQVAARGVEGAGGALPYRDRIQACFGRHDISAVKAHSDPAAGAAAGAMGAEAFATGDRIAFAGTPALHTAAHEAAHVVQQRGGVHLEGGVGAAGDSYEQHADRVADAVVAGRSAEALLDQVAPPSAGTKPPSAGAVQHKLVHGGRTMSQTTDLGLPDDQQPSAIVQTLLADPANHYLPDGAPDYQADSIHVLEDKKYLLGESHGDGMFAARTAKWSQIQTMKEAVKGVTPKSEDESAAVHSAGMNQRGIDAGDGLPLEDYHAYALTRLLMLQQRLSRFDLLLCVENGEETLQKDFEDLAVLIVSYTEAGLAWCKRHNRRPDPGTRGAHFLALGIDVIGKPPYQKIIEPVVKKTTPLFTLNQGQLVGVQTLIKDAVDHLIELIDTRPLGGGFLGFYQSKQGPDPVPNRAQLVALAQPGSDDKDVVALDAGGVLREAAMVQNILAAPAPLLVQVGDLHVDRLVAAIGGQAVPVKEDTDFDMLTRRP